jgi:hypothetical protein
VVGNPLEAPTMTRLEWVVSAGLVAIDSVLVIGTISIRRGLAEVTAGLKELNATIKGGRITEVHLGRPGGNQET